MADTAKRSPMTLIGTSATGIYAAPSTTTYGILRFMHITNETAGTITVTIGIDQGHSVDAVGKHIYNAVSLSAGQSIDWSGFLPLATPDQLYGLCSSASGMTVVAGVVEGP